jgi:hypothetical protein
MTNHRFWQGRNRRMRSYRGWKGGGQGGMWGVVGSYPCFDAFQAFREKRSRNSIAKANKATSHPMYHVRPYATSPTMKLSRAAQYEMEMVTSGGQLIPLRKLPEQEEGRIVSEIDSPAIPTKENPDTNQSNHFAERFRHRYPKSAQIAHKTRNRVLSPTIKIIRCMPSCPSYRCS